MSIEEQNDLFQLDYAVLYLIRDPLAMAVYVYRSGEVATQHPCSIQNLYKEIKVMAEHFHVTELRIKKALHYLEVLDVDLN